MAITATARGTGGNNTAATSVSFTPSATITAGAGKMGVLVAAADNAGSGGATTVWPASFTDSAGNTWTRRQNPIYDPGAASAGVDLAFYTAPISSSLSAATSISFAGAVSVTAKAWALWEISCSVGTPSYVTGAAGTGSATGTPTITTSSITSGDVVIGGGGSESASTWTGDSDTSSGSWSTAQSAGFGTGTSGMAVTSQCKVVTATATQTYNPTLTSADVILGWIQITEVVPQTISPTAIAGAEVFGSDAIAMAISALGFGPSEYHGSPTISQSGGGGTTYWADTFTRSVGTGWGTADTGGAYTTNSTASTSVDGTKGIINIVSSRIEYVSINQQDVDVKVKIREAATLVAGVLGIVLRVVDTGTFYRAGVEPTTGSQRFVRFVASVSTNLGTSAAGPTLAADGSDSFWIRAQAEGINPTTLRMKAWKDGDAEPGTWAIEITDSQTELQVSGGVGIRTNAGAIPVHFDDATATSIGGGGAGDQNLSPSAIDPFEVFGADTVAPGAVTAIPTAINPAEVFGSHALAQALLGTGITSQERFGSHTVSPGAVSLLPQAIPPQELFGAHTVARGSVTVAPTAIAPSETFGSHIVASFSSVSPSAAGPSEVFGSQTVARGPVTVAPSAAGPSEVFGAVTVSPGPVTLGPTAIAPSETFGTPVVLISAVVAPTAIPTSEVFGATVVARGAVTVSPTAIPSSETLGAPVLLLATQLSPTAISSSETFGQTVVSAVYTLLPSSAGSQETFGSHALTSASIVSPTAAGSSERFGVPVITVGAVTLQLTAITTEERFGSVIVSAGQSFILPSSISSVEKLGNAVLAAGPVNLAPSSIPSTEAFGSLQIVGISQISAQGIPTGELVPSPLLTLFVTSAGAIASGERTGLPILSSVVALISLGNVASSEYFGLSTVLGGGIIFGPKPGGEITRNVGDSGISRVGVDGSGLSRSKPGATIIRNLPTGDI